MWIITSIFLIHITLLLDAQTVVRQNVGVIYEQLPGQVITGHDTHQIILAVPYTIPDMPSPKPAIFEIIRRLQMTTIGPRDSKDARMLQQAADLDTLVHNMDANIIMTMKNIKHFLQDPINSRPKRAILSFLGELFKTIFGSATTKDIDAIMNIIAQLEARIGVLADVNVKTAQGLHDAAQQHQAFIDVYVKEQDAVDEALLNITQTVDLWSDDFSTTLTSLQVEQDGHAAQSAILSAQTVVLLARLAYHQGLAKVETSLRLLSTGTLAPDMIRPTELAEKLKQLDIQLKDSNAGAEVTVMDTAYYYSQPVALYTYSRTHLYIHLNIIISSTDSAFNIFQILTTDVPINTEDTNSTGSTIMVSSTDFLAVNNARTLYMEMTTADLHACHGQILRVCSRTIPRIRSDKPTCHMATFTNDQEAMLRLCTFHVQPLKPRQTRAIALDKDRYLITTNIPVYHIICHHKTPTSRMASAYAVVGVPCRCHLQFDGLYLPNTMIPCNSSSSTHFLMHTVNMPILNALATSHIDISPDSLHTAPIHLPPLHTAAVVRALMPLQHLPKDVIMDLTPFTDTILQQANDADEVLHRPLNIKPETTGVSAFFNHSAWSYIMPILTILNSIVIVIVAIKLLGRRAVFAALPSVSARPMNITWKQIPQTKPYTPKTNQVTHLDDYLDSENILTMIIIVMTVYLGWKIARSLKHKIQKHFGLTKTTNKTNPTVTLKVYNGHNNHTIQLVSVPYEMDCIKQCTTPALTQITPSSCPYPRITMSWAGPLVLKINDEYRTFFLPNHIILPLRSRFTIIPALNDPTTTTALVLRTSDMTISLPEKQITRTDSDEVEGDLYQTLLQHPPELTALQLLTALVRPKIQTGNET